MSGHWMGLLRGMPVKRADGRCVAAAAAYITGERRWDARSQHLYCYAPREVAPHHAELFPAGPLPTWARPGNANKTWQMAVALERRVDAQEAMEWVGDFPPQLTFASEVRIATQALTLGFTSVGLYVEYALHLDPGNHHLQALTSLRRLGPDGFSADKVRPMGPDADFNVHAARAAWGVAVNSELIRLGRTDTIEMRSYRQQGSLLLPLVTLSRQDYAADQQALTPLSPGRQINHYVREHNAAVMHIYGERGVPTERVAMHPPPAVALEIAWSVAGVTSFKKFGDVVAGVAKRHPRAVVPVRPQVLLAPEPVPENPRIPTGVPALPVTPVQRSQVPGTAGVTPAQEQERGAPPEPPGQGQEGLPVPAPVAVPTSAPSWAEGAVPGVPSGRRSRTQRPDVAAAPGASVPMPMPMPAPALNPSAPRKPENPEVGPRGVPDRLQPDAATWPAQAPADTGHVPATTAPPLEQRPRSRPRPVFGAPAGPPSTVPPALLTPASPGPVSMAASSTPIATEHPPQQAPRPSAASSTRPVFGQVTRGPAVPFGVVPVPPGLPEAEGSISRDAAARGGGGSLLGAGAVAQRQAEDAAAEVATGTVATQVGVQLTTIGATAYELLVTWPDGGRVERDGPWDAAWVLDYVPELTVAAAADATIGIRPRGHAAILVDGLDREGVKVLRASGWEPALLLQTAPALYQAWLRLSMNQLPDAQLVEAASILSGRWGLLGTVTAQAFGQLAGVGPANLLEVRAAPASAAAALLHGLSRSPALPVPKPSRARKQRASTAGVAVTGHGEHGAFSGSGRQPGAAREAAGPAAPPRHGDEPLQPLPESASRTAVPAPPRPGAASELAALGGDSIIAAAPMADFRALAAVMPQFDQYLALADEFWRLESAEAALKDECKLQRDQHALYDVEMAAWRGTNAVKRAFLQKPEKMRAELVKVDTRLAEEDKALQKRRLELKDSIFASFQGLRANGVTYWTMAEHVWDTPADRKRLHTLLRISWDDIRDGFLKLSTLYKEVRLRVHPPTASEPRHYERSDLLGRARPTAGDLRTRYRDYFDAEVRTAGLTRFTLEDLAGVRLRAVAGFASQTNGVEADGLAERVADADPALADEPGELRRLALARLYVDQALADPEVQRARAGVGRSRS